MISKILVVLVVSWVLTGVAAAQSCSNLPYTLTNGQTADASQVMADFNYIVNCVNSTASVGGIVGQSRNLTIVRASSTSLTITADELMVETALGGTSYKAASLSNTFNGSSVGVNGMDTGGLPTNGYVSIYAIYNPSGPTLSVLGTTASQTTIYGGSNMPSGYTASALIGIWPTDGSAHLVGGQQYDRRFSYNAPVVVANNVNPTSTLTSQSISAGVPAAAKSVDGLVGGNDNNDSWFEVAADTTGTGVQLAAVVVSDSYPFGFHQVWAYHALPILTPQTIFWASNRDAALCQLDVTGYTF